MAASSTPSKQGQKSTNQLLFRHADGRPYNFWIQTDLDPFVRANLVKTILVCLTRIVKAILFLLTSSKKHGGRVCDPKEFPRHGFLLIDSTDPGPVHAIKGSFNRPTKKVQHLFMLVTRTPTPLRHVLSYHFIDAVVSQGSWDHHDVRQWGFPIELAQSGKALMTAVKEFKRTIKIGEDEELEKAWVVTTGAVFDSYNSARLAELEPAFRGLLKDVQKDSLASTPDQQIINRNYVRGRFLVDTRADWRVRFHIHETINKERRQALVKCIMASP
jgi:hypothetical protein